MRINFGISLYLIAGIFLVLTHACKKEQPSAAELLTAVKWKVDDFCGPVSDPYTWTFNKNGVFVQEDGIGGVTNSTWSLKDNDKVLVFGGLSEVRIISLTETELKLKGYDLFSCMYVFHSIPF